MTLPDNLTKNFIILFLFVFALSCKQPEQSNGYAGVWMEIQKEGNTFQWIDCGYAGEILTITNDSVYHKGVMEDFAFKADLIKYNFSAVIGTASFLPVISNLA